MAHPDGPQGIEEEYLGRGGDCRVSPSMCFTKTPARVTISWCASEHSSAPQRVSSPRHDTSVMATAPRWSAFEWTGTAPLSTATDQDFFRSRSSNRIWPV